MISNGIHGSNHNTFTAIIKRMKTYHKLKKAIHHSWPKKLKITKNMVLVVTTICILLLGLGVIGIASLKIPDFNSLEDRKSINSTKIYDRTGEVLLFDIYQDIKRTNITFQDMGANIKNATLAIEDSEFYNHNGIRITSTVRAVFSGIFNVGIGGGGSTITQQLVKNTLLTQKKTYTRKIKEWVLALKVDGSMPKDKILELYLNEAPYGGTVYGIEEASKTYFDKKAYDLSLAEAAYLAAIPQAPTYLSPYGKNKAKLDERKNLVLFRMKEIGFITTEEYELAKKEEVVFVSQEMGGIKAPHFVFFIEEYLENKYGAEAVEQGGLRVTTTLDYELQEKAEQIVKEGALRNEKDWGGSNAGLVAIDPKTGQILTMVGSRDYFDKEIDGNYNIATAQRQPGSSFKPFIYATAFNKGFTPETVLFDVPTEFQTTCDAYGKALPGRSQSNCYMPANYDGNFRGPLSLRQALGQSINVIAVKLFYLAGLRDSLKMAESMGISTLSDIGRYGLTLVIGGGEVTLLDMTSAYGVLANEGIRNPYTGILKVEDMSGKVLEEFNPQPREVMEKNSALTVSDILADNVARTPTFGANSVLRIAGRDIAVKTGTTNNNRDAWTVGYSPSVVVGVWAGNNDNKTMRRGGSAVAGPIWNKFISEALKNLPSENFEKPNTEYDPETVKPALRGFWQGNENFFIDKISGKLATEFTPKETRQEKIITNVHTILYWINKKDILGPAPTDPTSDPQFRLWEAPIQKWWSENSAKYQIVSPNQKPTEKDDVHTQSSIPKVVITEPSNTKTYQKDQRIQLKFSTAGLFPLQKIDVFINDIYAGTSETPISFSFIPSGLENLKDENEIRVIFYDTAYNRGEVISSFEIEN